jgi:amino-acid N-acetyltransferase
LPELVQPAPAKAGDLQDVLRLINGVGLPTEGISDTFPSGYVVIRDGALLLGVAGLETYDDLGLLRSVCVAAGQRGRGLGRALVGDRLRAARRDAIGCVYLLTNTAADYFRGLGFAVMERAGVDVRMQQTREFASICPASATCLALCL